MPRIDRQELGVAFDMHGCPNRCRHCWHGYGDHPSLSGADARWGVARFREFLDGGSTPVERLSVSTWFREPDYRDDCRRLHGLEFELSDGEPMRHELLSAWRLARDDAYAGWAKSVGPDTCQISLFGMRETTDWFHRRPGAFDDALEATERLFSAGMTPRWQVFLTTKLLPELTDLVALVERTQRRARSLGGELRVFLNLPSPDHEARRVEELRPTADQIAGLPEFLLGPSRAHFGRDELWRTEADLHAEILGGAGGDDDDPPEEIWFLVCGNRDVFSNLGTLEPWWRLGNLKRDPVGDLIDRFEADEVLGFRVLRDESPAELSRRHGTPTGRRLYSHCADLLARYRGERCEERWIGS